MTFVAPAFKYIGPGPNNSFKPNLLRYTNNVAGKACHVVGSATQVGLTQALGGTATMQQLEDFARSATAFCTWAEARPGLPDEEIDTALQLVSQLYAQALDIPPLFDEEDAPAISHDEWVVTYKRFGALPFNYYAVHSEPTDTIDPSPGTGDLADDLADIWRDLKGGLALYHKGNRPAAAWEWRNSFQTHWGRHATSALYALHCWRF